MKFRFDRTLACEMFSWLVLTIGCQMDPLEKASKEFKEKYCGLWEVVDIGHGDRFGEPVIVVGCPSQVDRDSLRTKVPEYFQGFRVYMMAPMWGIGGLSMDSADTKLWVERTTTPPHNHYGTPEYTANHNLGTTIEQRDQEKWSRMSPEERKMFIALYIREKRTYWKNYASCGDKFLE